MAKRAIDNWDAVMHAHWVSTSSHPVRVTEATKKQINCSELTVRRAFAHLVAVGKVGLLPEGSSVNQAKVYQDTFKAAVIRYTFADYMMNEINRELRVWLPKHPEPHDRLQAEDKTGQLVELTKKRADSDVGEKGRRLAEQYNVLLQEAQALRLAGAFQRSAAAAEFAGHIVAGRDAMGQAVASLHAALAWLGYLYTIDRDNSDLAQKVGEKIRYHIDDAEVYIPAGFRKDVDHVNSGFYAYFGGARYDATYQSFKRYFRGKNAAKK